MVTIVIKQGYVNDSIKSNDSLVHEKYHGKLKTEKSGINI